MVSNSGASTAVAIVVLVVAAGQVRTVNRRNTVGKWQQMKQAQDVTFGTRAASRGAAVLALAASKVGTGIQNWRTGVFYKKKVSACGCLCTGQGRILPCCHDSHLLAQRSSCENLWLPIQQGSYSKYPLTAAVLIASSVSRNICTLHTHTILMWVSKTAWCPR